MTGGLQQQIQRLVKRGAEKHEIYAAVFDGHLFYDLFSRVTGITGAMAP